MPSRKDEELVDESPPSINPYESLGIDSQSTPDQIKSAYRKQALKHHPDKASEASKAEAHTKFQEVAFAYAILSDSRRRSRYDTTGITSESLDLDDDDFDWTDFFRSQKMELADGKAIQKIKDEYQHSNEERADLIAAFQQAKGDMDVVYEEMMCSNVLEDDDRFRDIINDAINKKEAIAWKKYRKDSAAHKEKRVKVARKEEREALSYAEDLGIAEKLFGNGSSVTNKNKKKDDTSGLMALIQQRQKGREETLFDKLEVKYGGAKMIGKGKKRTPLDEPPEEAFANNRKKRA